MLSGLGLDVEFVDTLDKRIGYNLVKRARNRGVLVILADLPSGYGRSTETVFFGRKTWLASGWIDLAHATASIVTVFSPMTVHRNVVEIRAVVDPKRYERQATFRLACLNAVTGMLEEILQVEPWSWMMFDAVSRFFRSPAGSVDPRRAVDS